MRHKTWRSNKDREVHLLCAEGADAFEALPPAIRNLGPWTGSREGEVDRLRLPYRLMLIEQGFLGRQVMAGLCSFGAIAPFF
jgi:hypothetical protein